jgi:hypothetical protein
MDLDVGEPEAFIRILLIFMVPKTIGCCGGSRTFPHILDAAKTMLRRCAAFGRGEEFVRQLLVAQAARTDGDPSAGESAAQSGVGWLVMLRVRARFRCAYAADPVARV